MGMIQYYEVEQTRVVKVAAESPVDAARVAQAAFDGDNHRLVEFAEGKVGSITTPVVDTRMDIQKERF